MMAGARKAAWLAGIAWLWLVTCAAGTQAPDALLAAGRADDAISSLQSRVSTSPNDAAAYNLLCRAHYMLEDWDAGIKECEKAVSLDRYNSRFHLWLGRAYGEKAEHVNFWSAIRLAGKVRNELETAVRLDPDNADACTDLAEYYLEAPSFLGGGRDKAEAQAQQLMHLDAARAYWVAGRLAEKRKDFRTAEGEYRKGIQASNGSGNAWLSLAAFYRHVGRFSEMEEAIQHIRGGAVTKRDVLMDAAEMLVRSGRNSPAAVELLRQYLASPTVEEGPAFQAHYLLGTLLEQSGDRQAAAQEYRTALSMVSSYSLAQTALQRVNGKPASGG
jgi:tetratricopeptide (TPR) repeat protein